MSEPFDTGIDGAVGTWPSPPDIWSFSSFREAEECPRRWMLRRASYPGVWARKGYPDQAIVPALLGDIVHGVLERVLVALHDESCANLADPCAVMVLKSLGGYSRLIEATIDHELGQYEENPRVVDRLPMLRASLRGRIPDIRQRVQNLISRTNMSLAGAQRYRADSIGGFARAPLRPGSHPEVDLRAEEARWGGRADLVTVLEDGCEITDYKTGEPNDHHLEQVQTYGWLWARDKVVNPAGLPARRLVLAYPTQDRSVEAADPVALEAFEADLLARSQKAEDDLRARPPEARPAQETCSSCSVRHLCDRYWPFLSSIDVRLPSESEAMRFIDAEVMVISRNGPRSWNASMRHPRLAQGVLLRTPSEQVSFRGGDGLRLLRVGLNLAEEDGLPVLTILQGSEIFRLAEV